MRRRGLLLPHPPQATSRVKTHNMTVECPRALSTLTPLDVSRIPHAFGLGAEIASFLHPSAFSPWHSPSMLGRTTSRMVLITLPPHPSFSPALLVVKP